MAKLFMLMFVWGPAMVGHGLGWLVHHPDDWTGPAVMVPLGALVTAVTYRAGLRKRRVADPQLRDYYTIGMAAGAGVGVMLFVMHAAGALS